MIPVSILFTLFFLIFLFVTWFIYRPYSNNDQILHIIWSVRNEAAIIYGTENDCTTYRTKNGIIWRSKIDGTRPDTETEIQFEEFYEAKKFLKEQEILNAKPWRR